MGINSRLRRKNKGEENKKAKDWNAFRLYGIDGRNVKMCGREDNYMAAIFSGDSPVAFTITSSEAPSCFRLRAME